MQSNITFNPANGRVRPREPDTLFSQHQAKRPKLTDSAEEAHAHLDAVPDIAGDAAIVAAVQAHVSAKDKLFC
jgi:hypothetical protein